MQQTKAYSFDFSSICSGVRKGLAAVTPDTLGKRGRGRPAGVELCLLLASTIRQKLFTLGGVEKHLDKISGTRLAASTVSRRLARVDRSQLEAINQNLLGPIGNRRNNPEGYHGRHRLVGIDGTRFTLQNTEAILEKVPKSKCRRSLDEQSGEVAFPQIYASSLVELGPHNPLAVNVGTECESEMELGCELIKQLGEDDMLIGDRLYGVGWFLHQLIENSQCGAMLLKVSAAQTSREIEQLSDASWIVEVDVRSRRRPADIIATHRVREIRYQITSTDADGRRSTQSYRLWTNLMDCETSPAEALIGLYKDRWEHEGYYRELKLDLKKHKYLNAQLMETACIEIYAMVWASALIARERQRVALLSQSDPSEAPVEMRRISFANVREDMKTLCALQTQVGKVITEVQFKLIAENLAKDNAAYSSPKRRRRSCPRKVRQNVRHWPKVRERTESSDLIEVRLTS